MTNLESPASAEPEAAPPPLTHPDDLQGILERVSAKKSEWAALPLPRRVELLQKLLEGAMLVSERWAEESARAKGLARSDPRAGEEWLSGPMPFVQNVRMLVDALAAGGEPKPAKISKRADGRHVARVFPLDLRHKLLLAGTTADIWIQPGKPPSQGSSVKSPEPAGRLAVVLGAGNISAIPAMDALYKLFVEGAVVVLKMNPLNAGIGPLLETAFRTLVDLGYFAVVYGDASTGEMLVTHPLVDALHVTGANSTYESIVFGDGEERGRRKASGVLRNPRPFSAELGCVTPVIFPPGPYSRRDLEYQARHVAAMLTHNGGFNCDAAQVLVIAHEWLQKKTFLDLLREALRHIPRRRTWAGGAAQRREEILAHYPEAESLGEGGADTLPWTLVTGLYEQRTSADEPLFRKEAFCGALSVVELTGAADPGVFLERATRFANERLWGSLSACLVVHPAVADEYEAAVERAVADLRYGAVCVNAWPGVVFALAGATWGAFPGHEPTDIQSGVGVVHNALLFDHPEKTVVRAPFRSSPPPPYFGDLRGVDGLGRALTLFESNPTWGRAWAVARAGLAVKRVMPPRAAR